MVSCNNSADYILVSEDGIFVEQFDSTNQDENKYNENNTIYKPGTKFRYSFEYLTPENEKYYFKVHNHEWEFVKAEQADVSTIKDITIKVEHGNPISKEIPDYNQTILCYKLGIDTTYSISWSGVIENEKNVWMHPPRDFLFMILELNPFPFIQAPYEIGNTWTWSLQIGSQWGDKRWKTWRTGIKNKYLYEIVDKQTIETEIGELECFIIDGRAKSELGETRLRSYFNTEYGFVKLNYTNIDSSKINLELVKFQE
ncbi:MAG: hypothetical protein HYZ14_19250 [Bacteroidetes bacterium]|nr:hypothetical protein [Bacteroidota bacterium]